MDPREIHTKAEEAREGGDTLKSLELADQATVAYQEAGDVVGLAEVLSSRAISLRHLSQKTGGKNYLILAKHTALAAVEIARASGQKEALAIPLYNLAKVQEELEEFSDSVASYKEAVENIINNPPETHNRPSVIADIEMRLAICEYKNGDKSALARAESALSQLEQAEEEKYRKDVWVSGGHMHLAEVLSTDDPQKAKEHLQKAKEIIEANPDLKIRSEQLQKVEQ